MVEKNFTRINEQIRIPQVRVIAHDGAMLGVLTTDQALSRARELDLDLVEVAPNEKPPVCRIMDYGKYKYQQNKKSHKQHTHHVRTKEIRLRPKTGEHDIEFKIKQARGFLEHKDKVIVTVVFRGRELAHTEEGRKIMSGAIAALNDIGKVESGPSSMGKRIICTITPRS